MVQNSNISGNRSSPVRERFAAVARTLLLALGLCFFAATTALSQPATGPNFPPPYYNSTLTTQCTNSGAALTGGAFTSNPCNTTGLFNSTGCATLPATPTYKDYLNSCYRPAGRPFVEYLKSWWQRFIDALKPMTAQLHASRIEQSMQIGKMMDAQSLTKGALLLQDQEAIDKQNHVPSELACTSGSMVTGITQTARIANALPKGYRSDVGKRSAGAPGTSSENGRGADQKARWDEYCQLFHDPANNNGVSVCPPSGTPIPFPNGDIDIEGFLLKDTVDMQNGDQNKTTQALIRNLVQPKVLPRVPDELIEQPIGKEIILKKQHIEAARSIATDVIAGIVSRRSSLPASAAGGSAGPPGPAPPPPGPPAVCPPSGTLNYDPDYLRALRMSENSGCYENRSINPACPPMNSLGCLGAYQYCPSTLVTRGCTRSDGSWTGTCGGVTGINSAVDFLRSPAAQDGLQRQNDAANWAWAVRNGLDQYIGQTVAGGVVVTPSGMLAAMHLGGPGALRNFLRSGTNPSDGITRISDYMRKFAGYNIPWYSGASGPGCSPPPPATPLPPPRPIGEMIREIRLKASVNPAEIARDPSYNEIMLALTKERFFDPEYFIRMQHDPVGVKQEQTAINLYISMQYQDIFKMQEQINSLLAARAALKFNSDPKGSQLQMAPIKP